MDAVTFRTSTRGLRPAAPSILLAASLLSACSALLPQPSPPVPAAPAVAPAPAGAAGAAAARREPTRIPSAPGTGLDAPSASVFPESPQSSEGEEQRLPSAHGPGAIVRDEMLHPSANRPYVLGNRRYVPMTARRPFSQRGLASWYGEAFHGRPTATGERFDMRQMTAAHPTLPLPSYARVRNLDTGRTVVVRVNDRGPFSGDRVIDLSFAAASHLGFAERGVAQVSVELLDPNGDLAGDAIGDSSPVPESDPVRASTAGSDVLDGVGDALRPGEAVLRLAAALH